MAGEVRGAGRDVYLVWREARAILEIGVTFAQTSALSPSPPTRPRRDTADVLAKLGAAYAYSPADGGD